MGVCTSSSSPVILGIGNPLLDIQVEANETTIAEYNMHVGESVLYESAKQTTIYSECRKTPGVVFVPGGGTQNTMRVAAALAASPNYVAYMGCVGNDEEAEIMGDVASQQGLQTFYQVHPTEETGVCACLIETKSRDRTMCTRLGAACCFDPAYLEKNWRLVENARVLYSAGFFVSSSAESMLKVAKYCAPREDKFWACGINAEFVPVVYKDQVAQWFKYANLFVANELEWPAVAKEFQWEVGLDQRQMLLKVCEETEWECHPSKPRIVVATQGAAPTLVAYRLKASDKVRVEEFPVSPIAKELIVDANGCGDSFVGGFLFGWSRGFRLEKCVEIGHLCARQLLQGQGNQFDLSELRDKLIKQGEEGI